MLSKFGLGPPTFRPRFLHSFFKSLTRKSSSFVTRANPVSDDVTLVDVGDVTIDVCCSAVIGCCDVIVGAVDDVMRGCGSVKGDSRDIC